MDLFKVLVIRICLGFRISCFGFNLEKGTGWEEESWTQKS